MPPVTCTCSGCAAHASSRRGGAVHRTHHTTSAMHSTSHQQYHAPRISHQRWRTQDVSHRQCCAARICHTLPSITSSCSNIQSCMDRAYVLAGLAQRNLGVDAQTQTPAPRSCHKSTSTEHHQVLHLLNLLCPLVMRRSQGVPAGHFECEP